MYYQNKLDSLKDVFGAEQIQLELDCLWVDGRAYPIVDDVIVLLEPSQYPAPLRKRLQNGGQSKGTPGPDDFAEDIQFTFGEEWKTYSKIVAENDKEFQQYFDLVDLDQLSDLRVCDLGCGIGRWSYFLRNKCRELVLVDFSEAVFVARENLRDSDHAIFFMGDIKRLPFRNDFAEFLFSLGVLHHLPTPALDEVVALKNYAPRLLIYLYYALDNRPVFYKYLLSAVNLARGILAKLRNPHFREVFCWLGAIAVYRPMVCLGIMLKPFGLEEQVPLYQGYQGKSIRRIRQDVYDRFFTRIEQRVSRREILELEGTFSKINVSDEIPYWHFLCMR